MCFLFCHSQGEDIPWVLVPAGLPAPQCPTPNPDAHLHILIAHSDRVVADFHSEHLVSIYYVKGPGLGLRGDTKLNETWSLFLT